jgi:hypothetical protein
MPQNNGLCAFAYNNDEINYVEMAYICALHAKAYLKNNNFCLITDEGSLSYMKQLYKPKILEKVIDVVMVTENPLEDMGENKNIRNHFDSPWTEFRAPFINSNKHEVYQITPYDKTILIDLDYLVMSNMLDSYFEMNSPIGMFVNAKNIRGNNPLWKEIWLHNAGIKMKWSTVIAFDKSDEAKIFFDMWEYVKDNYNYFKFLYNFPQGLYRTDYCVSIASHIMSDSKESDWYNFNERMYFSDQKDEIYDFNDGIYSIMANDQKENWKDIPVTWRDVDIHMMNKRSISRIAPKVIEYYEKELNL